jgi:hypothetical protein
MTMRKNLLVAIASLGLVAGCYTLPAQPTDNRDPDLGNDPMMDDVDDDPNPVNQDPMNPDPDPMNPDPDPMNPDPMNPDPMNPDPMNPDPTPDLAAEARAMFNRDVQPLLQGKCSVEACHGGTAVSPIKFCPPNAADYYSVVTSYDRQLTGYFAKADAPLINKIDPGPHNGATYTPAEIAAIGAWLDKELEARTQENPNNPNPTPNPTGPTPGQVSEQLIMEWSGCMNLADWNELEVAQAWAAKGTSEGPCIRCHINGQASFIATDESERMFNVLTTNRYFMLSYFAANVVDVANARMEVNRPAFDRVANGTYPHIEHPQFDVEGNAFDKLTEFYNRTVARKAANTCDAARMPPL